MQILRDFQFVSPEDRGATAAIGNFDGVHLGHQAVIDMAREAEPAAPLGVLTFEPHPREFFAPKAPPFRLMSREARAHRLEKLGVDILYEVNFNAALAALTPEEFARRVIAEGFGLRHVIVGADFCFGKGRAGAARDLQAFGAADGLRRDHRTHGRPCRAARLLDRDPSGAERRANRAKPRRCSATGTGSTGR